MKNRAFTLIELLVVVLIIGILAAIAIPQYQKSVMKSRWAEIKLTVNTVAKEFEMYKLSHGEYPPHGWANFTDSLNTTFNCSYSGDYMGCGNFWVDIYTFGDYAIAGVGGENQYGYVKWLSESDNPNMEECLAGVNNTAANDLCKSAGGQYFRQRSYGGGALNAYKM